MVCTANSLSYSGADFELYRHISKVMNWNLINCVPAQGQASVYVIVCLRDQNCVPRANGGTLRWMCVPIKI